MSTLLYMGVIALPREETITLNGMNCHIYDVSVPTINEYFRHLISVLLIDPCSERPLLTPGSYFVFAQVFSNDLHLHESAASPSLLFLLERMRIPTSSMLHLKLIGSCR